MISFKFLCLCIFANLCRVAPVAAAFSFIPKMKPLRSGSSNWNRRGCEHSICQVIAPSTPLPVNRGKRSLNLSGGGGEDGAAVDKKVEIAAPRELLAEMIGVFIIVWIGCGTVCSATFKSAQTGLWQIAAVWGIAVALAISVTGPISGAHLNPAVTLALALLRGFSWRKVIPFVAAQVAGAVAAAAANLYLFSDAIAAFEQSGGIVRGTAASVASACAFGEYWSVPSWTTAFVAEALGTAMLALVIFSLTNPKNKTTSDNPVLVPSLIGMTIAALISVIAPLTQAGFNPARDFGPRLIAWAGGWGQVAFKGWWLYVLAPLIGAPIGGFIADKILYSEK